MGFPLGEIDTIILGLSLKKGSSLGIIDKLRKKYKHLLKIIVLTRANDQPFINSAINLQINALLSRESTIDELLHVIKLVDSGIKHIGADLRENIAETLLTYGKRPLYLTVRELEVLKYLCTGLSPIEVAKLFGISLHTIRSYQRSIMRKMGVSKTTDMMLYAFRNGLYEPS